MRALLCLSARGTAPCAGRDDGASEKLRGSWVPRLRDVARQDLPAPLLRADARSRFPAMFYYVDNTVRMHRSADAHWRRAAGRGETV